MSQASPARKVKRIQVFKSLMMNASINWKSRKRCNAYMKDSTIARRCPEYVSRARNLDNLITKIADFRDNSADQFMPAWKEAASFTENPSIPKGYLRRNTKKFRMCRPYYNQKKNEFAELIQAQPEKVRTKKYAENVQFNYHLETFHGFSAFDLTAESDALDSMLPKQNVDDPFAEQESWRSGASSSRASSRQQQQQQKMPPPRSSILPYQSKTLQPSSSSRPLALPPPPSRSQQQQQSSHSNSRQQHQQMGPPPSSRSFVPDRSQSLRTHSSSSRQLALPPPPTQSHREQPSRSNSRQQQHPLRSSTLPNRSQSSRPQSSSSRQLALPPPSSKTQLQQQSHREQPSRSNSRQQHQQMGPPPSRSFVPDRSQSSRPSSSRALPPPPSQSHREQPSRSNSRQQQQRNPPPPPSRSNFSSHQQQQQPTRSISSRQLALPPPVQSRHSSRQQHQQTKEIVLFDSKSPKQRYNGPEISQCSTSNSSFSRRPLRPLNDNGSSSFAEQSSLNQIASILDYDDENGLLRSFYTKYHLDQFCSADENEKDYKSIEELANSDLVEYSIANPPPNGLRFREYSKTDYKKMRQSTKKLLREWKESLGPGLYDDDAESGYDEDGEEPIETWNRLVRESKKNNSRKRPYARRSFDETNRKNDNGEFVNESFESVQSEPQQITIQETIQRTRIIATPGYKDLRKIGRNATNNSPRIVEIPDVKRSGTCVSTSSLEPSPKKKRRQTITTKSAPVKETPKTVSISQSSIFKTPANSRNSTIRTPSTLDIFHRLQSSGTDGETPVRRSPRVSGLKAICYKV